jgi:chromosome segregation ATPase
MSILWFLFALAACAGGAFAGMRYTRWQVARERVIAEYEDPRDTEIRELLAEGKVLRKKLADTQAAAEKASEELALSATRAKDLEAAMARSQKEFKTSQGMLHDHLGGRTDMESQLDQLRRENDGLKARAQELEMELRLGKEPDLLDPSAQVN